MRAWLVAAVPPNGRRRIGRHGGTVSPRALGVRPSRPSHDLDHDIARGREPKPSRKRRARRRKAEAARAATGECRQADAGRGRSAPIRMCGSSWSGSFRSRGCRAQGRQFDRTVHQLAASSSSDEPGSPTDTAPDSSTRPVDAAIVLSTGGLPLRGLAVQCRLAAHGGHAMLPPTASRSTRPRRPTASVGRCASPCDALQHALWI